MHSFLRIFRFWLPVVLWLAVIALESMFLSSRVTSGWLWRIYRFLHVPIDIDAFDRFHHLLRKAGHVTGYGILCVLVFRAWYRLKTESKSASSLPNSGERPRRIRGAALALAVTLITAILDEWHQSFDPTRTASARDVALDVFGGMLFLTLALFVFRLWRARPAALEIASL